MNQNIKPQRCVKLTWELADQVWGFQLEAAPWEQCNPALQCRSWHMNRMQADQGRPVVTGHMSVHEFETQQEIKHGNMVK